MKSREEIEKFVETYRRDIPWKFKNDYMKGVIDALSWVLLDSDFDYKKPTATKK